MSAALMMQPNRMVASYGCRHAFDRNLTPAQRRRVRKKLRKIYGMTDSDRKALIAAWRANGEVVH